jgi:hypothetical protein
VNRWIVNIYRRLDELQQRRFFRIAATVVALALCGAFFGSLLSKSYSLQNQRSAIIMALFGKTTANNDEAALSLKNQGEIFLNGRRYGGTDELRNPRLPLFDEQGYITNVYWVTERMLADQRPSWAPDWLLDQPSVGWMVCIIVVAWLLLIIWLNLTIPFLITAALTALPVLAAHALDAQHWELAFAGIGLLTFTFLLLTRAALALLFPSNQVLAVAHTVVKEASRRGLSLFFIITLLVVLPLLPMALDSGSPLRYRIQSYMSWSLGLTFAMAAVMTLFFACATVSFEIRDRQIWQLMTKPLARFNYLAGKWLGVMIVNLILLTVAGISIFTFVQYLRQLPVAPGQVGDLDALAVRDEVLTARLAKRPDYLQLSPEQIRARIEQRAQADPKYSQEDKLPLGLRQAWEREARQEFSLGQRTVPPLMPRLYNFSGLKAARQLNSTLTLRYRFHILRDDEHKTFPARFVFLDSANTDSARVLAERPSEYVPTMTHSFPIDANLIQDDGTLHIGIVNMHDPGQRVHGLVSAINFEEKDFEILYKVDTFESNFVRAMITQWIKLSFLAALGIGCATFLSFPVACLLSFTIFVAGILGPFLATSLEYYGWAETETAKMDWSNINLVLLWLFEKSTAAIARTIVFFFSSFGEYRPTQNLVEGRLIPWSAVGYGILKLGLIWSGVAMAIGFLVLRRRELATYSGHG